ncbi:MAG: beta-ketoacyl reductase, partial [Steroidobacteraceae bacterium]
LRRMTFPFARPAEAFRYMAQAKHIGRIVFRHPAPVRPFVGPNAESTYLVTGGTRGLGLQAATWLAGEGAGHLVLVGRGEPDASASKEIERLRTLGCDVRVVRADLSIAGSIAGVLNGIADMPPVRGVVHCAGVLDDGMLAGQTEERLRTVMRPKADAAWALHEAFGIGSELDFLVFYSSLSAVFGSPGQGNYVAANAFLDALAAMRIAQGLPALSIGWGAWSEIGMAASGDVAGRMSGKGMRALTPAEGVLALDVLLQGGSGRAGVAPTDWSAVAAQFAGGTPPALLELMLSRKRVAATVGSQPVQQIARELEALPPEQLGDRLLALVRHETAVVLGLDPSTQAIAVDQTFPGLGLDSLTSVELRNRLQNVIGRQIAATAIFEYPTVTGLSVFLSGLFVAESVEEEREEVVI